MSDQLVRICILSFSWLLYFTLHSILASLGMKTRVRERLPAFEPYYRLAYNIISTLLIVPILWYMHAINGPLLIAWDGFFAYISLGVACLAVAGFFWTVRYYDMNEFMGLSHVRTKGALSAKEGESFILSPLHRFVRHPWYFFGLLIVWTRDMDLAFLVTAVAVTIYFIIGSRLEEKKLLYYYGKRYELYMKMVPGLLPLPWRYLSREGANKIMDMETGEGKTV